MTHNIIIIIYYYYQIIEHLAVNSTLHVATSGEDFRDIMTFLTVSSNQPTCTNLTILNDNILEGCEAFFVSFEVVPNFSGVAAIPRDADKSIVVIVDDLIDGTCNYYSVTVMVHQE